MYNRRPDETTSATTASVTEEPSVRRSNYFNRYLRLILGPDFDEEEEFRPFHAEVLLYVACLGGSIVFLLFWLYNRWATSGPSLERLQ